MFAACSQNDVRFDHQQQRWLAWTRNGWREDKKGAVRVRMKNTARHRMKMALPLPPDDALRTREIKWALESENRYRIDAALELAKSEPPISDSGEGWDSDPWLFRVANGIVDLRTGKLREATQKDRITKRSPVTFDPDAKCLRFEEFLSEIFEGDPEMIGFMGRGVGYSLTGSTREQCLFACLGEGANGKSTLLEILLHLFGDYGIDLPFSSLEVRRNGSTPGEGVNLPGTRFAKAVEICEGKRLDEARIKAWTGGDTITVRPLYRNAFSFRPMHKLWLCFNHKPVIADDSPALWRRIHLVQFPHKFEGKKKDSELPEKLKTEAPGVLNWAIRGCLVWQEEGLNPPQKVEGATREYQEESDALRPFLEDRYVFDPAGSVVSSELWRNYQEWAKENGERLLSRSAFAEHLKRHGLSSVETGHDKQRIWRGLTLRISTAAAE